MIIILLIPIIVLILMYFVQRYITLGIAMLIHMAFFISVFCSLTALFIPQIYKKPAEIIFEDSSFAKQLQNLDGGVNSIFDKVPGGLSSTLKKIAGSDNADEKINLDLYSSFITFMGEVLRWIVFAVSVVVMILVIFVRYAYGGTFEVAELRQKVNRLEGRLKELENRSA